MIDKTAIVHSSSIIETKAIIGANVYIGPFCIIGKNVEIGEGTVLKSHIVINGYTKIGKYNQIYQFTTIGEINQDTKYSGENTCVKIGNYNNIRESVTIHRGTIQGEGITKIGDNNLLMINTHIAHDCIIGSYCIFANNTTLGGHVTINDFVIIGGMTAIHQFCYIGSHVMIGGCSGVVKDIPPYVLVQGNHAKPFGINVKGLKRHGISNKKLYNIRNVYKLLYRSGKTLDEIKNKIHKLAKMHPEIKLFCNFFTHSTRGLIR